MTTYLFDCETNGLLDQLDTVHCLVLMDADTGQVFEYADHGGYSPIEEGVQRLLDADLIVAHNAIGFDIPAIRKVYPWFTPSDDEVQDTLVMARLIYTNQKEVDFADQEFPKNKAGSHSLEAWGLRLGEWKGDYGQGLSNDVKWANWNVDMQKYCVQDVVVLKALWDKIKALNYSSRAIDLEHAVQRICVAQEAYGFAFNVPEAAKLLVKLRARQEELEVALQEAFPPWWVPGEVKTPKKTINYKKKGMASRTKDAPYTEVTYTEFNAGSRHHIASRLKAIRGWEPKDFTPSGQPQVDEVILGKLKYPEAELLTEYLLLQKRLGQLADGSNAWLKLEKSGRIHGRVNTNGAATGRMTHSSPNVTQVPSTRKAYGKECRSLFYAPEGKKIVGADVSGLELRMLAHYMSRWDGGAYGDVILKSDVHTHNQKAAGLETRDQAKTFIYGFCYGGGDLKLGEIVDPKAGPGKRRAIGKSLRSKFLKELPALSALTQAVKDRFNEVGYLQGLDGRQLIVRSEHSALNMLLQGAGAVVCKYWMVEADRMLKERGLSDRCHQVATVHDELQFEADEEIADEVGKTLVDAIRSTGELLHIQMPLDGEYAIGQSWAETH